MKGSKRSVAIETRSKILEAATSLFTKTAFHAVAAEEIARSAGVAHGLVFHYFGTKARLYEEVSQAAADRLDAFHIDSTRDASTPSGKLRAFLDRHMDAVAERAADFIFHSRGGVSPQVQAIWENSRRNAIHLILGFYGVQAPSQPLVAATRAWLGFYDQLMLEWMEGRPIERDGVIETSLRLFPLVMEQAHLLGAPDAPSA